MAHKYGRPPGNTQDKIQHGMLAIPGGITLTAISGGSIDISGAVDGSDTLSNIVVDTHTGEDLLGGATVTWATSDIVFGRAIARKINENAADHHYWATFDGTDKVLIWPQDGSTSDTGTITATDTSFTATITDMNSEQAFVAAVRAPSWNYGDDVLPDTKMYQVGFDFAYLGSADNATTLASYKPYVMNLYPEDQILYWHMGAEGLGYVPSAAWKNLDIRGAVEGDVNLFFQAAAATNLAFDFGGY